ncbi:glycosyltransferase family 2 protein [Sediminibacterium soli]|uniref:glycosyltransferase family 2 protein n=1 Tax=Sediminibacterium soli TaxID=2698829 RepID=UPI0013799E58|nr:glycosyltransferase [Sediminibacterium soli]NCI47324.1 glycosyltransferase family 2 protein [Sediminibacterium soli]
MKKISIITAIHNGLAVNRLYVESLEKYTVNPYELIVIDNASTDGSREFFASKGAIVIANETNYAYPHCQNQGIEASGGDYLFFLNNDLILSPGWDEKMITVAEMHGLEALSASGIENMGTYAETKAISRKWKRIKNGWSLFGFNSITFRIMLRRMYGNWEAYCEKLFAKNRYRVVEGIVGDNVMMARTAIPKMGLWDERLQIADFDFFIRSKKRSVDAGDMKPCHIALGVYIHHFGKMTLKYGRKKPVRFADGNALIQLHEKWSQQDLTDYHPNNATLNKH